MQMNPKNILIDLNPIEILRFFYIMLAIVNVYIKNDWLSSLSFLNHVLFIMLYL